MTHAKLHLMRNRWMPVACLTLLATASVLAQGESDRPMTRQQQIEAEFAAWYLGAEDDAFELGEQMLFDEPKQPSTGPVLSEEQVDQLIDILQVVKPEAAERIAVLRQRIGERAGAIIAREHPRVMRFMAMRERDPHLFELRMADFQLNRESLELAMAYREAKLTGDADELKTIRGKLTQVVKAHFELREEIRQHELQQLEAQLDRLREELETRRERADRIIRERTAELTGELADQW